MEKLGTDQYSWNKIFHNSFLEQSGWLEKACTGEKKNVLRWKLLTSFQIKTIQIGKQTTRIKKKKKQKKRFGQHVCPHTTEDAVRRLYRPPALLLDILPLHIFKVHSTGLGDVSHMESFSMWLIGWRLIAPSNTPHLSFHPYCYSPLHQIYQVTPPQVTYNYTKNLIALWEVMFSQARQMYLITCCFPHFKYLQPKYPLIKLG